MKTIKDNLYVNSVEDIEVKLKRSISLPKKDNGRLKRKISPAYDVIKPNDEKCAKKDLKEDVEVLEGNKQDDEEYVECDVEFEECIVDGKTMYKCFRCEKMFIKTELLSDHYILEHTLKSGFPKETLTYKLSNGSIVSIEDNLERN